jgi:hypothetical protein
MSEWMMKRTRITRFILIVVIHDVFGQLSQTYQGKSLANPTMRARNSKLLPYESTQKPYYGQTRETEAQNSKVGILTLLHTKLRHQLFAQKLYPCCTCWTPLLIQAQIASDAYPTDCLWSRKTKNTRWSCPRRNRASPWDSL